MTTLRLLAATLGIALGLGGGPARGGGPFEGPLQGGARDARALVVALHGGSWSGVPASERARRLRDDLDGAARRAGLRLLVPVAPEPAPEEGGASERYQVPWASAAGEAAVLGLLEREVRSRRADPTRLYLAGHGAGGAGVFRLAARHPGVLAGLAVWSCAPSPVWDAEGALVGLVDDVGARLASVPVYAWVGDDDPHVDQAALARFWTDRSAAGRAGVPVERPRGAGGHGFGAEGPLPGLLFLTRQRRERERAAPRRVDDSASHHLGAVDAHVERVLELGDHGAGRLDERGVVEDRP